MRYSPYTNSVSIPNIIVDGMGNEGSKLVLSHWKNSGTPEILRADLSAQIVYKYLETPALHVAAEVVSNDHFDADGLVGIYTLLNPEAASSQKDLFIDIAAAGDFETYQIRDAARINWVLSIWAHPKKSPLNEGVFNQSYPEVANILYEELLPRFEKIVEKIDHFERFWIDQDEHLTASEESFRQGTFQIREYKDIDLAIVLMPDSNLTPSQSVQRMAIHNQTDCHRVLLMQENNFEVYYRYETFVEYFSRPTFPRLDMTALAEKLTKQESMDGVWSFVQNTLTPTLKLTGTPLSKIPAHFFKEQITQFFYDHNTSE